MGWRCGGCQEGVLFRTDRYTLAADGPQNVTLTAVPIDQSIHVYLNGLEQAASDWTLVDTTLSMLPAAGIKSGDLLDVLYATEEEPASTLTWTTVVAYSSTGWKELQNSTTDPNSYDDPSFDDSAWAVAQAAFGNGAGPTPRNTAWSATNQIWLRRVLAPADALRFKIRVDNIAAVFVNGVPVFTTSGADNGHLETGPFTVTDGVSNSGANVIAIQAIDTQFGGGGDISFIDAQIEAGVYS